MVQETPSSTRCTSGPSTTATAGFSGTDGQAGLPPGPGNHSHLASPFFPSPLKDDRYDISDYTGVHPSYGTHGPSGLPEEANRRSIRVIVELVVNHTIRSASLFQRARNAPSGAAGAISTCGATRRTGIGTYASSSRTSSPPTGPGTRWPRPTTGIGSTPTSPT